MKNPLKITMPEYKYDTLRAALKDSLKEPYIEYTQGGSSRKGHAAKVAGREAKADGVQANRQANGSGSGRATGLGGVAGSKKASR